MLHMQHKAPHQIIIFSHSPYGLRRNRVFCLNSCCPQYVALMTHLKTASVAVAWCPSPTPLHLVAAFYCCTLYCVYVLVGVSEQSFPKHRHSEDESDRRVKGAERPTREATVKTVISLLARCPLLVQQHIIGGGARRACGCVCVWVCSCKPS